MIRNKETFNVNDKCRPWYYSAFCIYISWMSSYWWGGSTLLPTVATLSVLCGSQLSGKEQPPRWQCLLWDSLFSCLFSLKFIVFLLVGLGLHCCSCFSPAGARGLLSSPGAHASHAGGFSYCRENSIECSTFSSFSSQDLEHRLNSCGTWVYVPHVM